MRRTPTPTSFAFLRQNSLFSVLVAMVGPAEHTVRGHRSLNWATSNFVELLGRPRYSLSFSLSFGVALFEY